VTVRLRVMEGVKTRAEVIAEASRRLKGFNPFRPPSLDPELAARARCAIDQRVRQGLPRERAVYQAGLWFLGEAERLSGSARTAKRAEEALAIAHQLLATAHGDAAREKYFYARARVWGRRLLVVALVAGGAAALWWVLG
jgi:hypothetical protein